MLRSHSFHRFGTLTSLVSSSLHRLWSTISWAAGVEVPKRPLHAPTLSRTSHMAAVSLENGGLEPSTKATPPSSPPGSKKRPRGAGAGASASVQANLAQLQPKALAIAEQLNKLYPNPPIPLDHGSDFQLLCAVVLSAQTTDKKVNEVTPELFRIAPDAGAMAALDVDTIAHCIRQLGLAPTKAKNLKALSQMLVDRHGGRVPETFEELEELPGVGHKTASVVMAQVHGHDAFPVDTHIHRLTQRWGLTEGASVVQTEADLKLLFPPHMWRDLHLQIIFFGREKCPAQRHDPVLCPICSWAAVPPYNKPGNSPLKPGQKAGQASPKAAAKRPRTAKAQGAPAGKRGRKTAAPAEAVDGSASPA